MEIPEFLLSQAREGKVVLFLGAGASFGAKNAKGQTPPLGKKLGEMISDKFLGGAYKDYPLNQIGELAISESDLTSVQEFIRDIFEGFEPTEAHLLMTTFRWDCIATTNYDLLIEKAYRQNKDQSVQIAIPFIENGDRVQDKMLDNRSMMLLKLHGCITRTANATCPLILTTDQYIDYLSGRDRIFDHLKSRAFEHPIVFVGYTLQDPNLRAILLELASLGEKRPRYYLVSPHFDDVQRRFWEGKRISPLPGTFEELLTTLNQKLPTGFRGLAMPAVVHHPIENRFVKHVTLSRNAAQFLENHVDYVKSITATEKIEPKSFYKGDNPGWSAIEQKLDCRRKLVDEILTDYFIDRTTVEGLEVLLIKAHAGSGKSVCMRRIAWDAAHTYNVLCLFLRPSGVINTAAIQEIIDICEERVFLFVDKVTDRIREINTLANEIGYHGKSLTIVMAERLNEWNVLGEPLSHLITEEYALPYLSESEITSLIGLLEQHNALGTLSNATPQERKSAFAKRADRQILVALHEATLGRPFEDIIEDEYQHILPYEAQRLYLTVCVLNRLDIRVRAGLISRSHQIAFEEFQERFFQPLEHIVRTEYDKNVRDNVYFARHPHIAEIVFERILNTQETRYEEYIRCIQAMNLDYSTDRQSFLQMIRGRSINDLFSNNELVKAIYDAAKQAAGEDPNLYHQMGVCEMGRPGGNLIKAQDCLFKARSLNEKSNFIKHSIAELYVRMADNARTELERFKFLDEAAVLCQELKRETTDSYAYHTLVKIGIRRVRYLLESPDRESLSAEFEENIKTTEANLFAGLQNFPGDSYLLSAESELADILDEEDRALQALEKAFFNNPRSTVIARRLSSCYAKNNKRDQAKQTIEKALEANSGDRKLHYLLAKLFLDMPGATADEIEYHFRRSFSPGDKSYDAQLLYGRQLFINGKLDESKQIYRKLAVAPVPIQFRTNLLYPLDGQYFGSISTLATSHFWIRREGPGDFIFGHRSEVDDAMWNDLTLGSRVSFRIGFNFKGPTAFEVRFVS